MRPAGAGRAVGARHRRRGARPLDRRRGALRDRALGHVDQLPLAPELHGRPRELEPPAAAREPGRPLAAHERRDRRGRHGALPRGARARGRLPRGRDGAWRVAARRPHRPEQEPGEPGGPRTRGTTARATAWIRSTSPATSTSTCGSGRSSASRAGRAPTSSRSASPTTWRAWCRRSRRARCPAPSPTSPASRRGRALTVAYELLPELTPVVSAGEGFRSLDAGSLTLLQRAHARAARRARLRSVPPCSPGSPYSQVTSFEGGRSARRSRKGRFTTTLTAFQTNVANELVFEVGLGRAHDREREHPARASSARCSRARRRGCSPRRALSVQTATFDTLVAGSSHYVPNVPAVLWRTDVNAHGQLVRDHATRRSPAASASATRCSAAAT